MSEGIPLPNLAEPAAMFPFWDEIIEPALRRLKPQSIVEIGCERGLTTQRLLRFCQQQKAVLHAVDPEPQFDVDQWQAVFGERLNFHRLRSLEVLPRIGPCDAALIDGDHNWYTVYHELTLLEESARGASRPFPLVMLHDVGWPYGRRDLYYDPETIPEEYRHPFAAAGVQPGASQLSTDGLNAALCNARSENTPCNGVLTAVEDFQSQASESLKLTIVPGFHGLGMLYPVTLSGENEELGEFLNTWDLPDGARRYIDRLENGRIQLALKSSE